MEGQGCPSTLSSKSVLLTLFTMSEDSLDVLKIKRRQVSEALLRYEEYLATVVVAEVDFSEFEVRYDDSRSLLDQFKEIQSQIETLDAAELDNMQTRREFEKRFYAAISSSKKIAKQNSQNNSSSAASTSSTPRPQSDHIRLPKIDLPKFTGLYEDWLPFHDTFKSLIHENTSINDVQKLHYLKSSVCGDAKNILHSLETSSSNYEVAWKLLNERYNNLRLIARNHLKELFSLPVMNRESLQNLRKIVDSTNKHLQALKALGRPVSSWDDPIIYLISDKLDETTRKEWESVLTKDHPTLAAFLSFLEKKCQILESVSKNNSSVIVRSKVENSFRPTRKVANVASSSSNSCFICSGKHTVHDCEQFLKMPVQQRISEVRSKKLCANCFKTGHVSFKCFSHKRCPECHKKHNKLLHDSSDTAPVPVENSTNTALSIMPETSVSYPVNVDRNEILLSTAVVNVKASDGSFHKCRLLLDSGSQCNFVTTELARNLKLPQRKTDVVVVGVGRSNKSSNCLVRVDISSTVNSFNCSLDCLVLDQITGNIPLVNINRSRFKFPENISLADPDFCISNTVDMLIGSGLFWKLLCVGQIKMGTLTLQKTCLGWVVAGPINKSNALSPRMCSNVTCEMLHKSLEKFWELDCPSNSFPFTKEEQMCNDHFRNNFSRNTEGRFVVKLPFRDENPQFGDSKGLALKRLYSLERKFLREPHLKTEYVAFINEYISLGHMKLLEGKENPSSGFYMPHHAVVKDSSLTTKLRVVFDGSAKSGNGASLNDALMVGPVLQQDLFSIVTRLRFHKYVLLADIVKMYRQILVSEEDTRFQRILWRDSPKHPVKTYELKTVTYGTASASFLAVRCLHQLAIESEHEYPLGSEKILKDFYVDDLLTGAETKDEIIRIKNEISSILAKGGFTLQKWASNDNGLLRDIPRQCDTTVLRLDKSDTLKTLGLSWNAEDDAFLFSIPQFNLNRRVTKRTILSDIAQLFDPMGLLNPVTVVARLLMQRMWQIKINWDESCPLDIHTTWVNFRNQLPQLNDLRIPRRVVCESAKSIEIHGFCDASEVAYGACLFLKTVDSDGISYARLICSKSRVAPIKQVTLARLELCGALLLARQAEKVISCLPFEVSNVSYWTDSTIVLSWINACSRKWNTFVANRVAEIQRLSDPRSWKHVNTRENPADILSRGCTPSELMNSEIWWFGPQWLRCDSLPGKCVLPKTLLGDDEVPEMRRTALPVVVEQQYFIDYARFSSFSLLTRVTARCLRFIHNARTPKHLRSYGFVTADEIRNAIYCIVKDVQGKEFHQEIIDLRRMGHVSGKSKLVCLNPFVDDTGVIRVGGRLRHSTVAYDNKHQMLLPARHRLTDLIIKYEHAKQLHCGLQGTLAAVRIRFWPISARSTVKRVLKGCLRCFHFNPKSSTQIMGDLPPTRVQAARPFSNCGVDYFGPLKLKQGCRKNAPVGKAYGVVFVCFATKAVHCELATDLTTEGFIAALKRFTSRRGKVKNLYSDNGSNFVGANRELKELRKQFSSQQHKEVVMEELAEEGITWHFIPPNSPHFGGLWEAAVKSFKRHLQKVAGNSVLRYEELYTLLVQIEAVLNSRPLCAMSDDPNDMQVLTPAHFLIGEKLNDIPEPCLQELPQSRLSRWQLVQRLKAHFWSRWHKEYLQVLQNRYKWKTSVGNQLSVGRLVLLRDDNQPPFHWKMGRVVEVHPGTDGIVRAATVRTAGGVFRRAATRLSVLPTD